MPLLDMKIQEYSTVAVGHEVKEGLFGVNMLFDRDRSATDPSGQTVSPNYVEAVNELGAKTFRYPGGTISERLFDMADPFGAPNSTNGVTSATLTVRGALDYADQHDLAMTFVMPTYRFLGTTADTTGHRAAAVDVAMVHDFVTQLLNEALTRGVTIDAIELGNEWVVDNTASFGTRMTPVEYGRIASSLAAVTQGAINDFVAAHSLPAGWTEPDIVVQVGPGGKAERFAAGGQYVSDGYTGPTIAATELIFREFNTDAEQSAVDGLVTHRYLTGSSANITGWAYSPFDTFERLAATEMSFGTFDRYVTEWNVCARNTAEMGLKQAGSLVALLAEMVGSGVDQANIWAVQQNNGTRLTNNKGFAGETYAGLSIAGETFRLLHDATVGLTYTPITIAGDAEVRAYGFGSDDATVVYLVNTSASSQTLSINPSQIAAGYHHVWGATLGISGGEFSDPGAIPQIVYSNATMLGTAHGISITLDAYEVIQLTFTTGNIGVSMEGDDASNQMVGTDYADTLSSGSGADDIRGGKGNDQLSAGEGKDTIEGGGGDDFIGGGAGDDRLVDGAGSDTMEGGAGADVFALFADGAVDVISDFELGIDRLDLSALGRFYTVDALGFIQTANGAELRIGEERVVLIRSDGRPLRLQDMDASDLGVTVPSPPAASPAPDQRLSGGTGCDTLWGDSGRDTMVGMGGGDRLTGRAGDDILLGGTVRPGWDAVAAKIYRLYHATLDRDPDTGGMLSWHGRLSSGERSVTEVAEGFVSSREFGRVYGALNNEAFVTLLYRNVLERNPDTAGLAYWTELLDNDTRSRAAVVVGFSDSSEFRQASAVAALAHSSEGLQMAMSDDVFRLYQATFGRDPDDGGFISWTGRMAEGWNYRDVVAGFVGSREFRETYGTATDAEFVTLLYRNVLHREPDAAGFATWTGHLAAGTRDRAKVVEAFAQSVEFTRASADPLRDWMRGRGIDDVLDGGSGDDVLSGGQFSDCFVFRADAHGHDRVIGFEPWDLVEFRGFEFTDAAAVRAEMSQVGRDVVFAQGAVSVTFENTTLSAFSDDVFLL